MTTTTTASTFDMKFDFCGGKLWNTSSTYYRVKDKHAWQLTVFVSQQLALSGGKQVLYRASDL